MTSDVTELLAAWGRGDRAALDELIPLVQEQLRRLAHRYVRGEPAGQPLQTTALINEAYLRLVDIERVQWQDRTHFFAVCARLMRRILVDAARARRSWKRGRDEPHATIQDDLAAGPGALREDVIALDEALDALARLDARKARVVELRFFGGLTVEETAEVLQVAPETTMRDWKFARVWLMRRLSGTGSRDVV